MKVLNIFRILIALCITVIITNSCISKADILPAKQYSVEDFFRNPEKVDFALSPDGKYFAYLAPYQNRLNVYVQEIGKKEAICLTSDTARNITWFLWGNDRRILYLKDKAGDGYMRMFGVDIDGTNLKGLTDFDQVHTEIIDVLPGIDEYVIVGLNKRNPQVPDPYRLNINTGEMTLLAENPGNIMGWLTDHDGKLRLAVAITDGINTSILFRETENKPFRNVRTNNFDEGLDPVFFKFDNKNLYAISNVGRDKRAVVEFDPYTGEEVRVIYENLDYDVNQLNYSRAQKILTSAGYWSWKREWYFFDQEYENMFRRFENELGQMVFEVVSTDRAETRRIIMASGDKTAGSYYLHDSETGKIEKIADSKPWLDEKEMADMIPVEYTSRDGLTIHGYLTFPRGYNMNNAKNMAVVVNPHGGPWARDIWRFSPMVQFLANRGYVVFQMNFRGSQSYGKAFSQLSRKQWGRTMQDDITDGVNWLIGKGIADPSRIAIYGSSYGGYATLAGITFTPDLYAAAIDFCGISNLFTYLKSFPPMWKPVLDMYYELVGDPVKD
ncbi:MAG: S9 family peptidase, partial [Bacteroidia bacterium]